MKRINLLFPILAFAIAIFASAFTAPRNAPKKLSFLYWYEVTYDLDHPDGAILSSSDFLVQDDKSNVTSPCPSGSTKDCLRGFSSQITTFPEESIGADQIMKP